MLIGVEPARFVVGAVSAPEATALTVSHTHTPHLQILLHFLLHLPECPHVCCFCTPLKNQPFMYSVQCTSGISIISGIILGTSFGHMALLALGILRPFTRTRPLASSKTIVDSLSIDLDLPLSRLVSRKLSRIRLHDQDKVDHLCLFDLLRDFRNRGTGVGGGATRTCDTILSLVD